MSTEQSFFERPILNSPYLPSHRHWELDSEGQPTHLIVPTRRRAEFISPIPKPRLRRGQGRQAALVLQDEAGLSTDTQQYASTIINDLRGEVDAWRRLPSRSDWKVSAETARLLAHWRSDSFTSVRPFFCQVEAVETVIWLMEVAPLRESWRKKYLNHLSESNADANPGLARLALKLATGAGKTTVMAMLIAWQTINAVRRPKSQFTKGFLIVAPGLTIRDRLNVLKPNDTYNYYEHRDLVPKDMLQDMQRAVVVIENYHKFKIRERTSLAKGTRRMLEGRDGEVQTLETEGQMLQRVVGDLMGMKNILVINDEAHHCYREKSGETAEREIGADEREEAKANAEAARVWITGLEMVKRHIGISRILDLSATPFFLRGSGYREGTLFPWTMSDFSLMDAIECGIVKLPRVPVTDNITSADVPIFRNLWENISKDMPKKGAGKAGLLEPERLPLKLKAALDALYSHYKKTFELWQQNGIEVPPCFIVVCNNTSASKLVSDYISGYARETPEGSVPIPGHLPLFRNEDENGRPYSRPRTILVDSHQMEAGGDLDENFRKAAAAEIERFRQELRARGEHDKAANLTDSDLLREVMNTVGRKGALGESVRCVVSVSMLTEGWDTQTVTHVLGVRAFGTQLLCEQVIGRALRRQSYELITEGAEAGHLPVEYADVLGIPFDFTAKSVPAPPQAPRKVISVKALKERAGLEINFPRVQGYRVVMPRERLAAEFNEDSAYVLTPNEVGPTDTRIEGIVGEGINIGPDHLREARYSTIVFELVSHMLKTSWKDAQIERPGPHLFMDLKRIAREWLDNYLQCVGGTQPAQMLDPRLLERASQRITTGITRRMSGETGIAAILDPYNPLGSTAQVNFNTTKTDLWKTAPDRCHVNWVVLDSMWEGEFCRVAEQHARVRCYVKNHALGFEVPYQRGAENHIYRPDFIVRVEDGHGEDDLLSLVVEIKGYRGEDAKDKRSTMETLWLPGINRTGSHGRWAFAEFTSAYAIEEEFKARVESLFHEMIADASLYGRQHQPSARDKKEDTNG
ncbi:BPTD_3080 family restriction endonuclease [Granulicella tundricola]|uniref:Type III restriction protein res subunit n=1 Tax=Granulicella tundricola (strain ATCC BAA-1859 / DSM 23138 / MP5ACTX9) TaxID=1198114 RepID=E8X4Y4_GRATM|nr:DEAD/DEAH box helicase family protein [Granulicella tundricola]ADW67176.1 type III restriction protein res subunit [Granulicella tundricola MP5ACTX9]